MKGADCFIGCSVGNVVTPEMLLSMAKDPIAGNPERMSTPAITHQQLADLVGTSRETITRVVKELKDAGWLAQEGKRYLVPRDEEADLSAS